MIARTMRLILNILWLVLAGWWLAFSYLIAAVIMTITIIGIPFAKQAVKLAGYALWPFGRTLIPAEHRRKGLSVFANILWFVLAGWWLALASLLAGCLLCLTIIGIPLGVASFKMAGAALVPFGKLDTGRRGARAAPSKSAPAPSGERDPMSHGA